MMKKSELANRLLRDRNFFKHLTVSVGFLGMGILKDKSFNLELYDTPEKDNKLSLSAVNVLSAK